MARFIIGAVAAAAALALGAVLSTETDASQGLVIAGAVVAAIVAPLGGYGTLRYVFDRLPLAVRAQVSLVVTLVAGVLEALVLTAPDLAASSRLWLTVLVTVAAGAGIWTRATSTADPRDDNGTPLVPVDTVEPQMPRRPDLA